MSKFYKDLKAGLEEIIAYKEGKIELRSTTIEIPEPTNISSCEHFSSILKLSETEHKCDAL